MKTLKENKNLKFKIHNSLFAKNGSSGETLFKSNVTK